MMIAIILWLNVLQDFVLTSFGKETFLESRLEVASRKEVFRSKLYLLMKIYDEVLPDTRNEFGYIPHWRCSVPFYLKNGSGPFNCLKNDYGDFWCSIDRVHKYNTFDKGRIQHCLMRARDSDVENSLKWEAPEQCSPLFMNKEGSTRYCYYVKGCTKMNKNRPWCSHEVDYEEDDKWSYCYSTAVVGRWSPWSLWNACSHTCGIGFKQRIRSCLIPIKGGQTCGGDSMQTAKCFLKCSEDSKVLEKQITRNKILLSIIGSIGALLLVAVLIGVLMYRRRGRRHSISRAESEYSVLYPESVID